MTFPKQYFLTSDTEQDLCVYICKYVDFDMIDYDMATLFIDNIANIGRVISANPKVLMFLSDVVYNGLMEFHNSRCDEQDQFARLDAFKDVYYIDTTNLLFIINVVINHYRYVHQSSEPVCDIHVI